MKVCVTCFEFRKKNLRRQPWRYIYEVVKGLIENNVEVVLITDVDSTGIDEINIRTLKKSINPFLIESQELLDVLNEENPDVIIMNLGLTSFLKFKYSINKPVIGVVTSPIYSFHEVLNVGFKEIFKNINHISIHILGSLIPNFIIRRYSNNFDLLVVLSEYNKKRLEKINVKTGIRKIIPGIDKSFLELPNESNVEELKKKLNPDKIPLIMYFTSPLTLRGTDTLVKAFAKVRRKVKSKLIILSRREHEELSKDEQILEKIARKEGISDSVELLSIYLEPDEVKEYVSAADIITLPFKIVISEIPLSILEAMALSKPVISTDIGCITELLNSELLVRPNDNSALARKILKLINDETLADKLGNGSRIYMENYPLWDDVKTSFFKLIQGYNNE
ncbi:MAG: D-inositol-3-phosphate glycosyltransferase [Candidatus Methanofastidiosum methylothiophilum]|uniref:D-inositol-3-phosphate glycosyltransferase n=1 Tax=Candidatus Methanofastidiosum methylothiophilum TaxID=1705564 RepID=A0A150IKN8_9EURY|nr:MAG: D-inositol-3-phosphate glycosyltransferase [Candidatus Methanofastidiosum methylthiophilus]KYC46940.1 MAG: D-inositol-3-phosphate glycosyltransferase [Candidatus Methanofastidiosum methylthiophilus]